jgi:uncharacterized protein (DUF1015 family)
VLPHERTLAGPKEDRYKLLRATGANLSPVVGLYVDPSRRVGGLLAAVMGRVADADVTDDDGVRHRLWVVPMAGEDAGDDPARELTTLAGAGPITIADGHHRYETALRYRDERRMTRSGEEDPAFDHILALLLETTAQPLTVLPTHRVVRRLEPAGVERLRGTVGDLFSVEPVPAEALAARFAPGAAPAPEVVSDCDAGLDHDPAAEEAFGTTCRRRGTCAGSTSPSSESPRRLRHRSGGGRRRRADLHGVIDEAMGRVASRSEGADAAFLLDPTPVAAIMAVAADGDVMPQKSTYFYPKALSGLVINPHEW